MTSQKALLFFFEVGSLFQLPRHVKFIKRDGERCHIKGVDHIMSGTPECVEGVALF